uniref:hypothetical protein n=1 Tax=Stappia sp. TaxID=1870903 RepID=UPI003BA94876
MSAAKKNGSAVVQHRPSLSSTCKQSKGAEMNVTNATMSKQEPATPSLEGAGKISTLAALMREASRRRVECDDRNARALEMGNEQAADFFYQAMNAADDDVEAFCDAITRVRAESIEDAGHQLSAAIRVYELMRGSVDLDGGKDDFAGIGRVLYSVFDLIESVTEKDLSAGVREDRLNPWRDDVVAFEQEGGAA